MQFWRAKVADLEAGLLEDKDKMGELWEAKVREVESRYAVERSQAEAVWSTKLQVSGRCGWRSSGRMAGVGFRLIFKGKTLAHAWMARRD